MAHGTSAVGGDGAIVGHHGETGDVGGRAPGDARGGSRLAKAVVLVQRWIATVLSVAMSVAVVGELVLILTNIVDREWIHGSINWYVPVSELVLVTIAFVGGSLAFYQDTGVRIDVVTMRMPARWREVLSASENWIAGGLAALTLRYTLEGYQAAKLALIPGLTITQGTVTLILGGGLVFVCFVAVCRLCVQRLRVVVTSAVPAAVIFGGIYVVATLSPEGSAAAGLGLGAALATAVLIAGVPITFALLLVPLVSVTVGHLPNTIMVSGIQGGPEPIVLLAVPFFVLAGFLLTEGGLGTALINALRPVLSRFPGGLLQLSIGTMFVFSGMTGAKVADVAAVGSSMRTSLRDEGYDTGEAAALLSACAAAGETIPPSIAALILGSITSISISTLFIAGILPAVIIGLGLSALVAYRALRGKVQDADHPRQISQRGSVAGRIGGGVAGAGLPLILLGGIESGVFTPTEASAVAVLYAVVVGFALPGGLRIRRLWSVIRDSAVMSGALLLLVAVANSVSVTSALGGAPQALARLLASLGDSKPAFLLLTILVLPIVGALLEGLPAILIFGPLFVPIASAVGLNLVHYGVVFILALGIGAFSPLLGVGFYTSCSVLGASVGNTVRRYWVYLGALIAGVCVVAFVPQTALIVPRIFHMVGS